MANLCWYNTIVLGVGVVRRGVVVWVRGSDREG
jgi:hypothetical protein